MTKLETRTRHTWLKNRPSVVSAEEWETARQKLLAKEKAHTHARDALAAKRRRMPWLKVEKAYEFDGPAGRASLLDLFDGRRQLIVYRAFSSPAWKAGRITHAPAAQWWPIKSPIPRISTPGTRVWHSSRVRHNPR